ncbi:MAG: cation:proton antiporter [Pseudomonadota bacterium]
MELNALMTIITQICVFLGMLAIVNHYFRRTWIPPEAWFLCLGVGYALLRRYIYPWLPATHLDPHVLFFVVLPLLIFASGHLLHPKQIRSQLVPIAFFAFAGVFASLALIGLPIAYLMEIRIIDGIFFAAAVSATDPGAVAALLKRYSLPEGLQTICEGESLFNDGLAVVVYTTCAALAIKGMEIEATLFSLKFIWALGGALVFGWLYGWITAKLLLWWQDYRVSTELTLSIMLALSAFIIGEQILHVSGVIAVLASAMSFIKVRSGTGPIARPLDSCNLFDPFWTYLSLVLNALLFFTLGFETGGHDFPITWLLLEVIAVLVFSRAVIVYLGSGVLRIMRHPLPLAWQNVLMLGGLRGPIAIALVLMMPEDYEHKMIFLCLAFVINFVPLLIQPGILQVYLGSKPAALKP